MAVEIDPVLIGSPIKALGAGFTVRVEGPQDIQAHSLRNQPWVLVQVADQLIGQGNCIPFIAAVDAGHDQTFCRAAPKAENLQGASRYGIADHVRASRAGGQR